MDFTERYQDACSAVSLAASRGDHQLLQELLREGLSVEVKDNRGWNPLHEAAACGSVECLQLLLTTEVRDDDYVNSLTHHSETPLYFAAQNGHLHVVQCLLRAGADVDKMSNDASSPLFAAVDGGHGDVVKLLVEKGAEVNGTHSSFCWSCLHQAVYKGHTNIVKLLVRVCSLEALDDNGVTPLFLAAQYGHLRCLEALIKAGADVNCRAMDLATPLFIASQEGHLSCVELLLAHDGDPNLYCNTEQWQLPIHAATQSRRASIVERLIPVTDRLCDRGVGKVSPVYLAVQNDDVACLQLLLRAGFSADAQECVVYGFRSPLSMVFILNSTNDVHLSPEITRVLLGGGARVSGKMYVLGLESRASEHLKLILELAGLPEGDELKDVVQAALENVSVASSWLLPLLRAGLNPELLLQHSVLKEAESTTLNVLLEVVNWKTLPSTLQQILSHRRLNATWVPPTHFDGIPTLAHMCRLAVRGIVGGTTLFKASFVKKLPIPIILQDYLQFKDIWSAYGCSADRD